MNEREQEKIELANKEIKEIDKTLLLMIKASFFGTLLMLIAYLLNTIIFKGV